MSNITVVKTAEDQASRVLQVTVPVERVREAETKAVRHYAGRARFPGFRPGKAPEAVVRKRLHEEIRQAVLQEVIREGWDVAKASESLRPIADPSVRNLKFEEGGAIEFELHVEVRPEVPAGAWGGSPSPGGGPGQGRRGGGTDGRLREQKATWLPVEGQKPSPGQMVGGEVSPLRGGRAHAATPFDGAGRGAGTAGAGGADHDDPARARPRTPTSASRRITPTRAAGARSGGSG